MTLLLNLMNFESIKDTTIDIIVSLMDNRISKNFMLYYTCKRLCGPKHRSLMNFYIDDGLYL